MLVRIGTGFFALLALLAGLTPRAALAQDAVEGLAGAYNETGYALFGKLAGETGNIVISPYSIGSAMAMATSGARGKTASQMVDVLGYPAGPEELGTLAEALDKRVSQPARDEDATITLANALHLTRYGDLVSDDYKNLAKTKFGAEIFAGSDLKAINDWVAGKTQGRIKQILKRLDPYSVCVLLNAVHFKAGWASPFEAKATAPGEFHLSRDETVQVPTMHVTAKFRLIRAHTFDAVALPYKGDRLAMIVFQPARSGAPGEVAIHLPRETIASVIADLHRVEPERLALSMPKFRTEFGADLIPPFVDLGLELPFDQDRADFTGMINTTNEKDRVHISQIRHKAFIEVDENGTEAAGSTAVEFAVRSLPPAPTKFSIDRPFLYMIVDARSGAVLFMGRVSDPRQ